MRGEHCLYGATGLSAIAVILLIFVNIGQISSGAFTRSLYLAEVNVESFGNGYQTGTGKSAGGLYDSANDKMGISKGLRQYYRYGIYNACGYQKSGSGVCNSTVFGYPMEPLTQLVSDTPAAFKTQVAAIIPSSTFKNNAYNHNMSRAGSLMLFVGSCFALLSLIIGVLRARIFFFIASACSGLSAFLLLIGATLWTALIAKDDWLQNVKVDHGAALGVITTAGVSLYLAWASFALVALSVIPYVVACCTFRRD